MRFCAALARPTPLEQRRTTEEKQTACPPNPLRRAFHARSRGWNSPRFYRDLMRHNRRGEANTTSNDYTPLG
jgi:hypothetical protein